MTRQSTRRQVGFGSLLVLGASVLAACTGSSNAGDPASRAPVAAEGYADVACPSDVDDAIQNPHTCGFLSVPTDRVEPRATHVSLFVVRIEPADGSAAHADPMYVVGSELGAKVQYAGLMPLTDRTDREAVIMEQRGTGRSEPALDCPEIDAAKPALVSLRMSDAARQLFDDAVSACYHRLTDSGIDVSDFGVAEAAQDGVTLRNALGIKSWNVISYGSASRIALEVARTDPEGVRAVLLDSPSLPGVDASAAAAIGTQSSVREVLRQCLEDTWCAKRFPGIGARSLTAALRELRAQPVTLRAPDGTNVVVDDVMLLWTLRQMTAGKDSSQTWIPSLVSAAAAGKLHETDLGIADMVARSQPYCIGTSPRCLGEHYSAGVVLTTTCESQSGGDAEALPAAADSPSARDAFTRSPYREACAQWPVPTAAPATLAPSTTTAPTLLALGALNAFSPVGLETAVADGIARLATVVVPNGGYNLFPTDCTRPLRDAWIDAIAQGPIHAPCLSGHSLLQFSQFQP